MLFGKNKDKNYKLEMQGNSIVDEKIYKVFTLVKYFSNRIKLNAFLIRLKFEMKKFNNEKEHEKNINMSMNQIKEEFPKMNELFQSEKENYLFKIEGDKEKIIDSVEFGIVDITNKKGKNIFHKDFSDIENERDLEEI